jgi:hypothetical protein
VGLDQLGGAQRLAADLALIAAGAGRTAVRADALDVTVGQEASAVGAVGLGYRVPVDVASLQQPEKNILRYLGVIGGAGGGEQVEGDAQLLP